jgi:hypothetical protein
VDDSGLSFSSPYTYISIILACSYVSGIWGLFMFFNITHQ